MDVTIENIIATTSLKGDLDLAGLADHLDGAQFDPDFFPGMMYPIKMPKAAVFLFKSGRMIVAGPTSYFDVEDIIDTFIARAKRGGFVLKQSGDLKTKNLIASTDLNKHLDLKTAYGILGAKKIEYDPRHLPGLIYKVGVGNMEVFIFPSGKLVVHQATSEEDAEVALNLVADKLANA